MLYVWFALLHFGSKAFKKRVTYPRTGFVSYPPAQRRRTRTVAFFVAMAVSAALGFLAVRKHLQLLQPALLIGPCMTFFLLLAGTSHTPVEVGDPGADGGRGGGVGLLAGRDTQTQASVGLAFYGAMYLAAGLITLALYLRYSQPAGQVAE